MHLLIFIFLAQLVLSGCFEKIADKACAYTVGTLNIDNGNSYSVASEAHCKNICDSSEECVAFMYVHSGQFSGGPTQQGTGACYYQGGTVLGTAVDHDRSCFVKKDCDAEEELVCDWISGDGTGNGEEKISPTMTGTDCVRACYNKGGFNGATVKANGAGGCWCERNMNSVKSSSSYKTCYIKPKITCDYVTGDGTGNGEVKIKDQISGQACAIECHRLGGYNGATVLSSGSCTSSSKSGCGCWCEKGMNAIKSSSTTYKTCYIREESSDMAKEITSKALAESSLSQTTNINLPDIVTYVFAAIGFLSALYVGAKYGSKAFCQGGDYAEVGNA